MAVQYNSDFTGQHNDEYDERITSLLNTIQAQNETITLLTNRITALENRNPIHIYTHLTLQENTYSAQYIPFTLLYNNNPDIYLDSNGMLRFNKTIKIVFFGTATFYKSGSNEIWMSLRNNNSSNAMLATAIQTGVSWTSLTINTIQTVGTGDILKIYMHDSGVRISKSGLSDHSVFRASDFIVIPLE